MFVPTLAADADCVLAWQAVVCTSAAELEVTVSEEGLTVAALMAITLTGSADADASDDAGTAIACLCCKAAGADVLS